MTDRKPLADGRPSIHNVAAYAGVSIATVSKVMQGVPTVRPENVVAVQNAIEALGYRLNPLASELRRGRRTLIGAIVPRFEDRWSGLLLAHVEREAETRGHTLLAASSRGSPSREGELVARMQDWRASGLVILPAAEQVPAALLLAEGPPCVFLDRVPEGERFDGVVRGELAATSGDPSSPSGMPDDDVAAAMAAAAMALLFDRIDEPDRSRVVQVVGTSGQPTG